MTAFGWPPRPPPLCSDRWKTHCAAKLRRRGKGRNIQRFYSADRTIMKIGWAPQMRWMPPSQQSESRAVDSGEGKKKTNLSEESRGYRHWTGKFRLLARVQKFFKNIRSSIMLHISYQQGYCIRGNKLFYHLSQRLSILLGASQSGDHCLAKPLPHPHIFFLGRANNGASKRERAIISVCSLSIPLADIG